MAIDAYSFGEIVVDGETYTADVVIHPGKVETPWWRSEGHRLDVADLAKVFESDPDTLVVGTGYYGNMAVPKATLDYLRSKGVAAHIARTPEAVALFNDLQSDPKKRVVAALHLTC